MKRRTTRFIAPALAAIMAGALLPAIPLGGGPEPAVADPIPAPGGTIDPVGTPLEARNIRTASTGTLPDGRSVIYAPTFGEPAMLSVVESETGELVSAHELTGKTTALYTGVAPDQSAAYVAAQTPGANLFRYDTATDTVTDLGAPVAGETNISRLTTFDENNVLYSGTFPNGHVWSYDARADAFTDFGPIAEGEQYARSMAYADGNLYIGTGTNARFFRMDVASGEKTEIALPAEYAGQQTFVNEMYERDGLVFAFLSPAYAYIVYDTVAQEWLPTITDVQAVNPTAVIEGKVYFVKKDNNLWAYDLAARELTRATDGGMFRFADGRGIGTAEFNDPAWPGTTVVGIGIDGGMWHWNPTTTEFRRIETEAVGGGLKIAAMGFAPNGKLYTTGYLTPGLAAEIDPITLETTRFRGPGQAEFLGTVQRVNAEPEFYMGTYTDAGVWKLDHEQPWDYPRNPRRLARLDGFGQERITTIAAASLRIAVGTVADKGVGSGAIAVVDPRNNTLAHQSTPVEGHSVSALQFVRVGPSPLMLGGTSTYQLGVEPEDPDARLFLFHLSSYEVLHVSVPVPGATSINQIIQLPDGRLWMLVSDSNIYELEISQTGDGTDPYAIEVTPVVSLFGEPREAGNWAGPKLAQLTDTSLVASAGGRVFTIDLGTLEVTDVAAGSYATPSPTQDGSFFFANKTKVFRYVPNHLAADASLAELTVDGRTTEVPEDGQVTVYVPPNSDVPVVSATPTDPRAAVEVTQAAAVPGTATVTVTSLDGANTTTVTVTFKPMPSPNQECRLVPPVERVSESLGVPLTDVKMNASSPAVWTDGRPALYVQGGTPGDSVQFGVLDAMTGELLDSRRIPELTDSLSMITGPDGMAYIPGFPGDSKIIRYNPETQETEDLGTAVEGETHITRIQLVGRTIWGGTFPNAHVFSYDIDSGEYTDHGRIAQDEWYARAIAHDGDHTIYVGTEGAARIIKWDLETGEKTDLPLPPEMNPKDYRISLMAMRGGLMFAYFGGSLDWHVYDPETGEWIAVLRRGAPSMPTEIHPETNKMYMVTSTENRLYHFDFTTREFGPAGWDQRLTYYTGGGGVNLMDLQDPEWPGLSVVGMGRNDSIWRWNPTTGNGVMVGDAELPETRITIRSLGLGPDEKIYVGYGFNPGVMTRFNPSSNELEHQRPFTGGQIHSHLVASDGTLYMGSYTGGRLIAYDPTEPYDWQTNPATVANFGDDMQDRLFGIAETDDGTIAIGGLGKRGHADGMFALYDPETGEVTKFPALLPGHEIISLEAQGSIVYGGTSIIVPGADSVAETAEMFAFDVAARELLWRVPLEGVDTVSSMVTRPDGRMWAQTTAGKAFLFDPETRTVVNEVTVGQPGGNYGFANMDYGVDGFIYGSTPSGSMYRMHPGSGAVQPLGFGRYAVQGTDGMLYFSSDTELFRATLVPVVDETAPVVEVTAERPEWAPGVQPQDHLVTATATDEYETCIQYRVNGGDWLDYTEPTLVQAEDVTVIEARATDSSGNVSEVVRTQIQPGRPNTPGKRG